MVIVTLTEFRRRLGDYVERVKLGETFVISERGVPVAKIIPLEQGEMEEWQEGAEPA